MSSSVLNSARLSRPPPHALFTRMSMVPHASIAAATIAWLSAFTATSVGRARASAENSSWSSLATRAPASSSRSALSTSAPSAAKRRLIPRPMPSPPPVTTATRSRRRSMISSCQVPELLPRRERAGHRTHPVVVRGPVGRRQTERVHAHLGAVPELVHAPHEEPSSVASLVHIAIQDRLVDPAVAVLDLAIAVDEPGRVILVVDLDDVGTDVEDRDADLSQRIVEELPQCRTALLVSSHPHVVHGQADQHVEVARVDCDGVASCELAD